MRNVALMVALVLATNPAYAVSRKAQRGLVERFSLAADRQVLTADLPAPTVEGALALEAPEPDWHITVRPRTGFDSNPGAASDAHGSVVGIFEVEPGYHFDWTHGAGRKTTLDVAYNIEGRVYEGDAEQFNEMDHTTVASLAHAWGDQLSRSVSLLVSDRYVFIGTTSFLNVVKSDIGYVHEMIKGVAAEGHAAYQNLEYFHSSEFGANNPDANRASVSIGLLWQPTSMGDLPSHLGWAARIGKLRLGYAHTWNAAGGSNFDYEGNGVALKLESLNLYDKRVLLDVGYTPIWNGYDNPNTLSPALDKRDDIINDVLVTLWDPLESTCRHASLSIL